MDITAAGLLSNCLPNLPKLTKTILFSALGQSHNSQHQDTLTEAIVVAARPVLQTPAPIKRSQDAFKTDYGVFGRIWISKYTIPEPPNTTPMTAAILDVRSAVELGITALQPPNNSEKASPTCPCPIPKQQAVETEWTAYRPNVSHIAPLPKASEKELYHKMMDDVSALGPTILYFHGGAHCLLDPAMLAYRWTTSSLAQQSNGRVLSVRYRLSPQNIFPAALIDAFVAYLALLAPPPNAFHAPVPPSQIVIAGDSSGAGLSSSLLLLLLTLSKQGVVISFHEIKITIPSPPCAGLALTSPWLDVSRCLPSCHENARWDIIAPPPFPRFADDKGEPPLPERASPNFPADDVWPASPPRAETYCSANMVVHPLVSPVAAKAEDWDGAPPVYVCVGWEGMQDEAEVFARKVHIGNEKGGGVVFDGYEGMPHCFAMVPWNWAGWRALGYCARFCRVVVENASGLTGCEGGLGDVSPSEKQEKDGKDAAGGQDNVGIGWSDCLTGRLATWTSSKTRKVKTLRVEDLGMTSVGSGYERRVRLTDEEVERRLERAMRWRVKLEHKMVAEWKVKQDTGKM